MKTKLLLIDDHPMVLEGLQTLLQKKSAIKVSAAFTNGKDAMSYLHGRNVVDIIFLDINMPGRNGFELCKLIKKQFPAIKVIVLSTFYERSIIARMIKNGASGYLSKTAETEQLMDAIEAVTNNKVYFGEDIQQALFFSAKSALSSIPKLTRREKEILSMIADGKTTPQIADLLFLSQLTVETHRKNMMHKLGTTNTAALIKRALDNGIL